MPCNYFLLKYLVVTFFFPTFALSITETLYGKLYKAIQTSNWVIGLSAWYSAFYPPPRWISEGAVSLLVAVLSTVIFCSCGKDDIPSSLSTDTSLLQAKLGQLVPNSRWQLTKALYTAGDVEINAAWSKMEVEFTADSAYFYRRDLVYDPISSETTPKTTLSTKCSYRISNAKIILETTDFEVKSPDITSLILISAPYTLYLTRPSPT